MSAILQATDLEVRRGTRTVLCVDELSIRQGDVLALIGPNGAGKTTLLQVLAALLKPARGKVLFKSEPVTSGAAGLAYRRQQAMVFQEPLLFATTVFENVAAGLKLRGVEKGRVDRLVQENLARFGIAHLAGRPARKISGGEAQRASLARALATEPQILFMDEPFSSLDPPSREALIEDLEKVLKSSGITAVMTTHDHGEARRLSNRMAVMGDGRVWQHDAPATVFCKPANRFVAQFVGVDNLIAATVARSENGRLWLSASGRQIQASGSAAVGTGLTVCVRPESVRLYRNGLTADDAGANAFTGRIIRLIPMGYFHKLHLDCGFALSALCTDADAVGWSVGDQATVAIPPACIHLIENPP